MAEKQSCVLPLNVSDGGSDRRQHEAAGSASARITGCGGNSTPTRRPEVESDGQQRPKVGNPDTQRPVEEIDVEYVAKVVDVDEDSAKTSCKFRQTQHVCSPRLLSQQVRSTRWSLAFIPRISAAK